MNAKVYNLRDYARRLRAWIDRCVIARWTGEDPGPRPVAIAEKQEKEP